MADAKEVTEREARRGEKRIELKKFGSWGWIWPTIIAVVIYKLIGVLGGLVAFGIYYWLKPRFGTWGAVAASAAIGTVVGIGLGVVVRSWMPAEGAASPASNGNVLDRFDRPTKPQLSRKAEPREMDSTTVMVEWETELAKEFGITPKEVKWRIARSRDICRDPQNPRFVDLGDCFKAVMAGRR